MRKERLMVCFFVCAAACTWAQQTPAPTPDQPAQAPIVRDPHSTKADLAVPLCPATFNDSLETDGIASKVDKNVRLPMPRYQPEAEFSDAARRLNGALEFNVVIGLVVNADGDTQELCLVRSAGYGLDANAANTVGRYRFVPAARDGKPVAYRISIEVYFRRYGGR